MAGSYRKASSSRGRARRAQPRSRTRTAASRGKSRVRNSSGTASGGSRQQTVRIVVVHENRGVSMPVEAALSTSAAAVTRRRRAKF
jgi:hypothetical protein